MKRKLLVFALILMVISSICGCLEDMPSVSSEEQSTSSIADVYSEYIEDSSLEETSEEAVYYEESSAEHIHSFKDATCTEAKICVDCGETEGQALGHNWASATCTKAITCSVCKITDGNPLGHNYYNGKCTRCNEKDPNATAEQMVWIPQSGKKYHSNSACSNMKNPSQITISQAKNRGYTACKKCY